MRPWDVPRDNVERLKACCEGDEMVGILLVVFCMACAAGGAVVALELHEAGLADREVNRLVGRITRRKPRMGKAV